MTTLTTTMVKICACHYDWKKLSTAGITQADDEPITYEQILDTVGLEDALWCCRAEPQHADLWRLFAVWCAEQVKYLATDQSSITERHAKGMATDDELGAVRAANLASQAVDWATDLVVEAAVAADWAAYKAAEAVVRSTTGAAARAAARAAINDAQSAAFRQLVITGTLP